MMRKKLTFKLAIIIVLTFFMTACGTKKENHKYEYEHIAGDLTNTYIYTLENGLKIYMSINKDEPRVQTNIAVRTGSKNDPSDATGLAHYLEHMLFKGTSKIATLNWEEEEKLLKRISDLYEKRRSVTDKEERKAIYRQIDSISGEAAKFAIPNEYDKLVAGLGAKGTNAFTSLDQTVYVNDIPSSELEKWLAIESERFRELVLRLFHTELEAVYEEYNRGLDSDPRASFHAIMKELFKKHTYGTQTTIGTGEDLKNPSMEKIHKYFSERYTPNNMAIILSGDVKLDQTVDMIKKYFGDYKSKELNDYTFEPEDEITEVKELEIFGTDAQWVDIAYRLPGGTSDESQLIRVFDALLANGKAGLIDLNLNQNQKVLNAYSSYSLAKDYSIFELHAEPKSGQTLEEAKELLLEQVEKIKTGDFEDWMIPAVIKNIKLEDQRGLSSNSNRASIITKSFIHNVPWSRVVNTYDYYSEITKKDIVDFANKYIKDNNYVVVYKKTGNKNIEKVEKPEITKVQINRNVTSSFANSIRKMESIKVAPVFDDYDKDIVKSSILGGKVPFYYVKNNSDKLFNLTYLWNIDVKTNPDLGLALDYMEYLGTDKYSPNELQIELFKKGLEINASKSSNRVALTLSGLEESLEDGIKMFESVIRSLKPNQEAYQDMVVSIIKQRENNKLNKSKILFGAMRNFAKYGTKGPLKYIIPKKELLNKNPQSLVDKITFLQSFKHSIYFYGSLDKDALAGKLDNQHKVSEELKDLEAPIVFEEQNQDKNRVYYVNYDMVQAEIFMTTKAFKLDLEKMPYVQLYGEYFGSGLSSIIFQEIRESKALAYSAFSFFSNPKRKDEAIFLSTYVGTQVDKLKLATDAITELMNNMPKVEDQFNGSKTAVIKKIETTRTKRENLFWKYLALKDLGIDKNPTEYVYNTIQTLTLEQLGKFFSDYVSGKNYTYCVIGNKKLIDKSILKSMGEYRELNKKEIFGY